MNALESYQLAKWRHVAYDCWVHAEADAEAAQMRFVAQRPEHCPEDVWSMVVEKIKPLFVRWKYNQPEVVITEAEARVLGLETD